jgi:hypothetical protein
MLLKFNEHSDSNQLDEYFKLIRRDCKPFLELLRKNQDVKTFRRDMKPLLFRGMWDKEDFLDKKVRKDRKAKDSGEFVDQKLVDNIFFEKWGIRPRSQGLFTTFSMGQAERYGDVYVVFPKGDFDYVVCESEDYNDLWLNYMDEAGITNKDDIPLDHIDHVVKWLHHYNSNIGSAINYSYETIFLCDSYYAIRVKFTQTGWSINHEEKFLKMIEERIYQ